MGHGKGRRGRGKGKGNGAWDQTRGTKGTYNQMVRNNEMFEDFYQKIIDPKEWGDFLFTLQQPLPSTFRVTAFGAFAQKIKEKLQGFHFSPESLNPLQTTTTTTIDNTLTPSSSTDSNTTDINNNNNNNKQAPKFRPEKISPPSILEWYPDNLAWYMNVPRKAFKDIPELGAFHHFLIAQTDQGNITRQEAVSMIPPLFLDIHEEHSILDMCAAPGSKTTQMLEMIHTKPAPSLPKGFVVANDADSVRCYMLVHQTTRLQTPSIVVSNHNAQSFPQLHEHTNNTKTPAFFDRILCDVPCSGDGTLRKNADLWKKWTPQMGLGLHRLQLQIALRATKLLKVGGRMVYSTCSMNPSEDEAVIAQVLRQSEGSIVLLDVTDQFPALKRAPGLTSWKICDRNGFWWEKYGVKSDERPLNGSKIVKNQNQNQNQSNQGASSSSTQGIETKEEKTTEINTETTQNDQNKGESSNNDKYMAHLKIVPSVFPPTAEEAEKFGLKRCMRLYPHFQDTGGFFIAVLMKVAPSPDFSDRYAENNKNETENLENETEEVQDFSEGSESASKKRKNDFKQRGGKKKPQTGSPQDDKEERFPGDSKNRVYYEEPFLTLPETFTPTLNHIKDYYGIVDSFPFHLLMTRSDKIQKIYIIAPPIKSILEHNEKLKVVNTGLKLFELHEFKKKDPENGSEEVCKYRICQYGLKWVLPFITKRIAYITHKDLLALVSNNTLIEELDPSTQTQLSSISLGSMVCVVRNSNSGSSSSGSDSLNSELSEGMAFAAWKGKTLALFLSKMEISSLKNLFLPKLDQPRKKRDAKLEIKEAEASGSENDQEEEEEEEEEEEGEKEMQE